MAQVSIPTIKSRYETGDRPSQQDYEDLIDTTSSQATRLGTYGNNDNTISEIDNFTVIDTFNSTEWRVVKYLVSISKKTQGDNYYYATELTVLVDGINLNVTEYGTIDNDGNIGTIDISRSGSVVSLNFTPHPTIKPVTVRYARIGLKA
jgi:hypothetical protein